MQLKLYEFKPENYSGDKPDIVLIHGTGGDASLWRKQVDLLLDHGFRCFVPELRGHGGTPEPEEPTIISTHIEDLLQTLEASGVRYPAIFVGHSLGAAISMHLAHERPELFVQLLAVSMPGKVLPIVADLFEIFLSSPYEKLQHTWLYNLLSHRYRVLFRTNSYSMQQILNEYRKLDFLTLQFDLKCPVHFCAGGRDIVALAPLVKRVHETIPGSTYKLFGFSGHCCMDDEEAAFNEWLLEKIVGQGAIKESATIS
jgi:pimeloyl-ACP methyl ester carboxylesterase